MKRTGLVVMSLLLMAAPAAAQVQADANVNVGGGGGVGGDGLAQQGFNMGARLVVAGPAVSVFGLNLNADMIPRYYLGYRLGKLGFLVGFNISSVATDVELPGDDAESSDFMFSIAPQVVFEVVENGSVALDVFGGPIIGTGSHKDADPDEDSGRFGVGFDVGARAIGYLVTGLGLHADLGFHLAFVNDELDEAPNDRNETDTSIIGFYGAVGVMGTL